MKAIIVFLLSLLLLPNLMGQEITSEQWNEEAKTDIRLLPKYGHVRKTEAQLASDQKLINNLLTQDSTQRKASDHLIRLGFSYILKDLKTAMFRFNQAYLLDSTNANIYWGYGAVYLFLKDFPKAKKQFEKGLAIDPNNPNLLTEYGTYFTVSYIRIRSSNKKEALKNLDSAIVYSTKSYELDPNNAKTSFKLCFCYQHKGDCENAWKYYDICKKLDPNAQLLDEEFTKKLKKSCRRRRKKS